MRKRFKGLVALTCMALCIISLSGCGDGGEGSTAPTGSQLESQSQAENQTESQSQVESQAGTSSEESKVDETESSEVPEAEPVKKESHYVYDMRALSSFAIDCGHDDIEVYWNDFLDAVVEGRTSFRCPDVSTCRYIQMELLAWYLPGADEWIKFPDNIKIKNGMASISYAISDEERVERLEQIKTVTESVLNDVLEDDYTDFEKALALYLYFVNNYTYIDDSSSWGGIMRVLTKHYGICDEFSRAYSYLLVQAGVDAITISDYGHRWSFVKLGDKYFHVDTTWGLGQNNLSYFMMTTSKRIETTGDPLDRLCIDLIADYEYVNHDYADDDDHFADFWIYGSQIKWKRESKLIYVREPGYGNGANMVVHKVSYEGY